MSTLARRRRWYWAAAGAVLAIAGVIALVVALTSQHHAPQPPPSAASPVAVTPATAGHTTKALPSTGTATPSGMPGSIPTHLDIPAIGVSSVIGSLGLNADGTVQVPPLSRDSYAGWYRYSPTPGQVGPSIILGHVDSARYGPGVFFKLGALRPRDLISITRADHTVAVFEVERVVEYPKDHFPTLTVYGNTNHPALRLITCGGRFDFSAHSYDDNIVAFATLITTHTA